MMRKLNNNLKIKMNKEKIDEEEKINILIQTLRERYKSIHIIRDRVQNVCIFILGFLLTIAGWLIQTNLIIEERLFYTFLLVLGFCIVRFYYFSDLEKGFKKQQRITARIEKALHLFDKNFFNASGAAIYPESWKESGKEQEDSSFFKTNYSLLYLGFFSLLLSLWLPIILNFAK